MDYKFIGWMQEGNHDKVWACIKIREDVHKRSHRYLSEGWVEHEFLTVWGRRGKKLQFNVKTMTGYDAEKLIGSKSRKGYEQITETKLAEVYPEFEEDLKLTTAMAKLSV